MKLLYCLIVQYLSILKFNSNVLQLVPKAARTVQKCLFVYLSAIVCLFCICNLVTRKRQEKVLRKKRTLFKSQKKECQLHNNHVAVIKRWCQSQSRSGLWFLKKWKVASRILGDLSFLMYYYSFLYLLFFSFLFIEKWKLDLVMKKKMV